MPTSAGQQLQQARQSRGLSIEEAATATRIRPHYLRALEAGDMSSMPSPVQARGFLRNYCAFLGLDFNAVTGARPPQQPVEGNSQSALPQGEDASQTAALPIMEGIDVEVPGFKAGTEAAAVEIGKNAATPVERAAPLPVIRRAATAIKEPKTSPRPVRPIPAIPGQPETPTPRADALFKEIGEMLQSQREKLSLPLNDIERYTHIRLHYLEAMEAGDFGLLPSFTQARGMLNHYARFLSLDTEKVLNCFAEALLARRAEIAGPPTTRKQAPLQTAGRLRRFLTMDAVVGSGLVILLVVIVIWGASRVFDLRGTPTQENAPPSVAEVLLSSPDASSAALYITPVTTGEAGGTPPAPLETAALTSAAAANPTAAGAAELPPLEAGKIQVFIVAMNRAWVQVLVDGKPAFTGRVEAGGAYAFTGEDQVELITGNAGALQVYLNQNDLGTPGAWNEVVHLVYTADGPLLPTPTITPTPTRTPRPSATPAVTRTPSSG